MTKKHDDFHSGMLAALAVVAAHDSETLYREIVGSTDLKALLAAAKADDAEEWAGLVRYGYAAQAKEKKSGRDV